MFAPVKLPSVDDRVEPQHRLIVKRQESIDAREFLDQEIDYLIKTMYDVVDQGILKAEAYQRVKVMFYVICLINYYCVIELIILANKF